MSLSPLLPLDIHFVNEGKGKHSGQAGSILKLSISTYIYSFCVHRETMYRYIKYLFATYPICLLVDEAGKTPDWFQDRNEVSPTNQLTLWTHSPSANHILLGIEAFSTFS